MIDFLFYPGSIAVIGASKDPQKVGYAVLNNIKKYKFTGEVFPINPKPEEILGHKTYQRLEDIGKDVDLAVIAIPARMVRPFLEKTGIQVFASLHRDILLDSITVRQLNEILGGKILCCEEGLDDFIESFSIGAMDVDSALKYFRRTPNKAVITGAHRSDIQLAALETSTKCIILTGGMYTNDVIIGKAKLQGVPIISVHDDTFTTVGKIESVLGKIRIREQKKVLRTKEIVEKEFDLKKLMKVMKIRS